MFASDMKNSLVGIDLVPFRQYSGTRSKCLFQQLSDTRAFVFMFNRVDIDPCIVSVVEEDSIYPAACTIPAQETVIRRNSPKLVIDNSAEGFRAVDNMIHCLFHNNEQYPFPASFV